MNKTLKISTMALAVVILGLGALNIADAFQGQNLEKGQNLQENTSCNCQNEERGERGPKFNNENHQAIIETLENKDYATWKELNQNTPMSENITEENFAKFIEMHELRMSGNFEEAKVIADELGLPNFKSQRGMHKGQGQGQKASFVDTNNNGICDNLE
ncbi:MAG: hypothetical protein K9M44_03765 [Candidatus Pacebacteria bacterium]|nr:hypothetical protein [Candidatus Paceibacterota bacterium]